MDVRVLVRFPRLKTRAYLGVFFHVERKTGISLHVADGHVLPVREAPDGTQVVTPVTDHSFTLSFHSFNASFSVSACGPCA